MKTPAVILIADDEIMNLIVLERTLKSLGHTVYTASNGREAVEKAHQINPDLILLDIVMPVMNGIEAARQLKNSGKTCDIPIVVVSSLDDVDSRVCALDAGVDDFLSKPVEKSELAARVRSSLKVKAYNDHIRNYQIELEREVKKRTLELERAADKIKKTSYETVYRLSLAGEKKDPETGTHILRMSRYAATIARQIGLDDQYVEWIQNASPMHDIGKIGVPDRILLKPGKLTAEEWEIMKKHTIFGSEILENSDSEFIQLAEIIARTHHEKWDGTGYPAGLKGTEIPIAGRICALADVMDALLSRRPYKPAYSLDKTFSIIQSDSGRHFDPDLVEALWAVQDQIIQIKNQFSEE